MDYLLQFDLLNHQAVHQAWNYSRAKQQLQILIFQKFLSFGERGRHRDEQARRFKSPDLRQFVALATTKQRPVLRFFMRTKTASKRWARAVSKWRGDTSTTTVVLVELAIAGSPARDKVSMLTAVKAVTYAEVLGLGAAASRCRLQPCSGLPALERMSTISR